MASRGARLVASLHRLAVPAQPPPVAPAAAPAPAMSMRAQSDEWVQLQPPVAGVMQLPSWESLARQQADVNEQALLSAGTGDAFALEDRNLTSLPWRRIFAVRAGESFVIYDANGILVNEPSDGVVDGRQSVEDLVNEFFMYYRRGELSSSQPMERSRGKVVSVNEKNLHASAFASSDDCNGSQDASVLMHYVAEPQQTTASPTPRPKTLPLASEGEGEEDSPSDAAPPITTTEGVKEGEIYKWAASSHPMRAEAVDDRSTSHGILAAVMDGLEADRIASERTSREVSFAVVEEACDQSAGAEESMALDRRIDVAPTKVVVVEGGNEGAHRADMATAFTVSEIAATDNTTTSATAAVLPTTGNSPQFVVGTRVSLRQSNGGCAHGMVAQVDAKELLVATDLGTWVTVEAHEMSDKAELEVEGPPSSSSPVVAFTYGHANSKVVGMLLGSGIELGFGGKMPLYMAHVSRPLERDERLRARKEDRASDDFAIGDIVQQLAKDGSARPCAAVVRVAYTRRRGTQQARKLLILLELAMMSTDEKPPATIPLACDQTFFPASWNNWGPVEDKVNAGSCTTLSKSNIRLLDKAFKTGKAGRRLAFSTPNTAIKFASANRTPAQISIEGESPAKAPPKSKANSSVQSLHVVAAVPLASPMLGTPCSRAPPSNSSWSGRDFVSIEGDCISPFSESESQERRAWSHHVAPIGNTRNEKQNKVQKTTHQHHAEQQPTPLPHSPPPPPIVPEMRPPHQPTPQYLSTPPRKPLQPQPEGYVKEPSAQMEQPQGRNNQPYQPHHVYGSTYGCPYENLTGYPPPMPYPSVPYAPPPAYTPYTPFSGPSPSFYHPMNPGGYPTQPPPCSYGAKYGPPPPGYPPAVPAHHDPYHMYPSHSYANHNAPPTWHVQPPLYQQQSTPPRVRAGANLARMRAHLTECQAKIAEEEFKYAHM